MKLLFITLGKKSKEGVWKKRRMQALLNKNSSSEVNVSDALTSVCIFYIQLSFITQSLHTSRRERRPQKWQPRSRYCNHFVGEQFIYGALFRGWRIIQNVSRLLHLRWEKKVLEFFQLTVEIGNTKEILASLLYLFSYGWKKQEVIWRTFFKVNSVDFEL